MLPGFNVKKGSTFSTFSLSLLSPLKFSIAIGSTESRVSITSELIDHAKARFSRGVDDESAN